jgi:glycosyltransferase involved in cell wall biosynthesis
MSEPFGLGSTTLDAETPLRVVLASWAPFHAGAEVAAVRLAIGLQAAGHEVTVVLGNEGETFRILRDADVEVRCLPLVLTDKFRWWRYTRAQRAVRQVLDEVQPDIVHANDLPTSQMVGQAAAQLSIPRICHHRWMFEAGAIDWLNKFGAERHVFVSQRFMEDMCRNSATLCESSRVMIHDCVPIPELPGEADQHAARRGLGLPLDKTVVLFAGQMTERKGIADLLRAWQRLDASATSSAELWLVGEDLENAGAYRREMEQLASSLGVPARFPGFRRDVFDWIIAADVCVVPSHVEPFGLAVLEAMAHARAVIGSSVGGIPEMMVEGETGLLVSPGSHEELNAALKTLLADTAQRNQFGRAGRARCEERFSAESHIEKIVDEYRQVVATHARPSK